MNLQSGPDERALRDYPISLRHSARAVFGSDYEHAEEKADLLRQREQDVPPPSLA